MVCLYVKTAKIVPELKLQGPAGAHRAVEAPLARLERPAFCLGLLCPKTCKECSHGYVVHPTTRSIDTYDILQPLLFYKVFALRLEM